jgi:hypothetical protein
MLFLALYLSPPSWSPQRYHGALHHLQLPGEDKMRRVGHGTGAKREASGDGNPERRLR